MSYGGSTYEQFFYLEEIPSLIIGAQGSYHFRNHLMVPKRYGYPLNCLWLRQVELCEQKIGAEALV